MIKKITIELSELPGINRFKSALFLFDGGEVFTGRSDGVTDEDGEFGIRLPGKTYPSVFPVRRLIGWAYLKDNSKAETLLKSIKEGGSP